MIRLGINLEPQWLCLTPGRDGGVWVHVRALDTATYQAAQARGATLARELLQEAKHLIAAGAQVLAVPSPEDAAGVAGFSQSLFAVGLAQAAIVDWNGVGDETGQPVPVTDDWVRKLMSVPHICDEFLHQYTSIYEEMFREGNASAPSQSGTTAAAATTAAGADDTPSPAPGASPAKAASGAPTRRTRRARKPVPPPGG